MLWEKPTDPAEIAADIELMKEIITNLKEMNRLVAQLELKPEYADMNDFDDLYNRISKITNDFYFPGILFNEFTVRYLESQFNSFVRLWYDDPRIQIVARFFDDYNNRVSTFGQR